MKISILGCGWLGLPLADYLIQRGHAIKGSTTTPSKKTHLENHSVQPFLLSLDPSLSSNQNVQEFWKARVLVLNIPPGRGRDDIVAYQGRQIEAVIQQITGSPIEHVVFISSTSVYPTRPGKVAEDDAIASKAGRASGNALLKAEQLLMESTDFDTTILRFGGLFGGDRHPAKYMAGKSNLGKGNAPVNLIHRDDCIAIITQIIEENITGHLFNAVADEHPARKDYYTKAAKLLGLQPPSFIPDADTNYKIVSAEKLKKRLSYTFIYPDPLLPLLP